MILYRLLPSADESSARAHHFHSLMSRIFLSVAIMEVAGTTLETIVVFWLFGSLWHKWTLPFKVVTPILHFLFSCAQGWGAWVFWQLSKKEARKAAGLLSSGMLPFDEESSEKSIRSKTDAVKVTTTETWLHGVYVWNTNSWNQSGAFYPTASLSEAPQVCVFVAQFEACKEHQASKCINDPKIITIVTRRNRMLLGSLSDEMLDQACDWVEGTTSSSKKTR